MFVRWGHSCRSVLTSRETSLVTKHKSTQIFIKYIHDIVLQISFLDIYSQNWITGSCLKLWQVIVKIRHWCEKISNISSRGWRACKNWFFMFTIFLCRGIFLIHHIWKKVKKGPEQKFSKFFWYLNISVIMPISHAKEILKYVLYFQTFLKELQTAAGNPILRIDV